jgi:hypothetical protein
MLFKNKGQKRKGEKDENEKDFFSHTFGDSIFFILLLQQARKE